MMQGILIVDKPTDWTSFDVIAKLRGILGTRKLGHSGTLDPMATGVLPVFCGGASKAVDLQLDHTKAYRAVLRLGQCTDTGDVTGTVLQTAPVTAGEQELLAVLPQFLGPRRLDVDAMQRAAEQFVGKHDFLALCAAGSSAAAHGDTVRTITDCHVTRKGDEVDIEVTADGYLYNMVRILAGTLCEVGAGRMQPDAIPGILASRDRSQAGPTLPAKGLFLEKVDYDL